jgi:hypothetical protein
MSDRIVVSVIQKRKEEESYLVVSCRSGKSALRSSTNIHDQLDHAIEFGKLMGVRPTSVEFTSDALRLMFS